MSNTSPSSHIRIYVVDDHPAIREAIRDTIDDVIDMEVCGESASTEVAVQEIGEMQPDVAIVDISLKDGHGFDLLQQIRGRWPEVEPIVYSMYDEKVYAERAVRTGASGYLMKSEPTDRLLDAIRRVAEGQVYLSRRMYNRVLGSLTHGQASEPTFPIDELTDREKEVFQMLGEGYDIEQIVDQLDLHRKTVETHRRRAKEKLGFDSTAELLQYAVQWVLAKEDGDAHPSDERISSDGLPSGGE